MPTHPRRPRRVRTRSRLVALALATVVVVVGCRPPLPGQDPFYDPPAPAPTSQPGDVLSSRPSTFTLDPLARTPVPGVSSWQIAYRSTDALGQPMAVTGTVLVPQTPWLGGDRPVVT